MFSMTLYGIHFAQIFKHFNQQRLILFGQYKEIVHFLLNTIGRPGHVNDSGGYMGFHLSHQIDRAMIRDLDLDQHFSVLYF